MACVLQEWVCKLTFMQQSVLITAVRGPDGVHKNHISKKLIRWLRRCILISAFDGKALLLPYDVGERKGGSFTGPSLGAAELNVSNIAHARMELKPWQPEMHKVLDAYMLTLDEVPHHFQLHFLHATEILGYCHPTNTVATWWLEAYKRLCNDMHLNPETYEQLQGRLGDNEANWRAREEVRAE
jgi:hypothetical protein